MKTSSINMQLNNVEYALVRSSTQKIEMHTPPPPHPLQRRPHISDRCYFFPASPLSLISTSQTKSIYLYSIITTSGLEGFSASIEDHNLYIHFTRDIYYTTISFLYVSSPSATPLNHTHLYPPPLSFDPRTAPPYLEAHTSYQLRNIAR